MKVSMGVLVEQAGIILDRDHLGCTPDAIESVLKQRKQGVVLWSKHGVRARSEFLVTHAACPWHLEIGDWASKLHLN